MDMPFAVAWNCLIVSLGDEWYTGNLAVHYGRGMRGPVLAAVFSTLSNRRPTTEVVG
jgi:hypothetical protein